MKVSRLKQTTSHAFAERRFHGTSTKSTHTLPQYAERQTQTKNED